VESVNKSSIEQARLVLLDKVSLLENTLEQAHTTQSIFFSEMEGSLSEFLRRKEEVCNPLLLLLIFQIDYWVRCTLTQYDAKKSTEGRKYTACAIFVTFLLFSAGHEPFASHDHHNCKKVCKDVLPNCGLFFDLNHKI
jgi:hypothetical protein